MEAEARGSWEPLPGEAADLITIAEAKDKFLKDAESGRRLGESTLKKYKLMLRHLEEFASKKGFVYLKQLNTDTLRDFRDSWHLGPRTARERSRVQRERGFSSMLADMRERGLTNLGFSGASRWSASESFLGGYLFDRSYGSFSTGVDNFTPRRSQIRA